MFSGVGVDILSIERMRGCLTSPFFVTDTFTEAERRAAALHPDETRYFAKVFAGKEAVFKCFGISADALGSWREIEVLDQEHGQPEVVLCGSLAALASERGVKRVLISLSYETEYAVAFAALVGGTNGHA